ncbi:hypothetical protein AMECASPLE_022472 [Ameca splendens]|uniref:Secreted protein n=1 Tax=Ameca splendens TaxID=208324 RepID=A0ABV0Y3S7_9TELE
MLVQCVCVCVCVCFSHQGCGQWICYNMSSKSCSGNFTGLVWEAVHCFSSDNRAEAYCLKEDPLPTAALPTSGCCFCRREHKSFMMDLNHSSATRARHHLLFLMFV